MYYLLYVSILNSYAAIRNDYGLATESGALHPHLPHPAEFISGGSEHAHEGAPIHLLPGAPLPLEAEHHGADSGYGPSAAAAGVTAKGSVGEAAVPAHLILPTYRSHKGIAGEARALVGQHMHHVTRHGSSASNPLAGLDYQEGNGISVPGRYADRMHPPVWRSSIVAGVPGGPIIPLRPEKIKPRRDPWVWEAHFGKTSASSSKSHQDHGLTIHDPSALSGIYSRRVLALHPSLLRDDPQHEKVLPRADFDNTELIEHDPWEKGRSGEHYIEPRSARALQLFASRNNRDDDVNKEDSTEPGFTTLDDQQEILSATEISSTDETTDIETFSTRPEDIPTITLLDTSINSATSSQAQLDNGGLLTSTEPASTESSSPPFNSITAQSPSTEATTLSTQMSPLIIYGKPVPAEIVDSTAASSETDEDEGQFIATNPNTNHGLSSTTSVPTGNATNEVLVPAGSSDTVAHVKENNTLPVVNPDDWMTIDTPNFPTELLLPFMGNPVVAGILGQWMGQLISSAAAANSGVNFGPNPSSCCGAGSNSAFIPVTSPGFPAAAGEDESAEIDDGLLTAGGGPWFSDESKNDQLSTLPPPPLLMNTPHPNQRWYPSNGLPRFSHQGHVPDEKQQVSPTAIKSSDPNRPREPRLSSTTETATMKTPEIATF